MQFRSVAAATTLALLAACGGGSGSGDSGSPAPSPAALPVAQFALAAQTVAEEVGAARIEVQLDRPAGTDLSLPYTVSGTASAPADHDLLNGTLRIAAGQSSATLTVALMTDGLDEGVETLRLTLGQPVGASLGARTVHELSISDCALAPATGSTQALTNRGTVQGAVSGSALAFLGIPYAAPPVGPLRFERSVRAACWSGVRPAISAAPICPQIDYEQGSDTGSYPPNASEDCLYLNLWRPQAAGAARPVMVFVHGGGNQQGSAIKTGLGTRIYDGALLASRGDAIVVTFNYRLGPLGFMVHPDLPAAVNAGLHDQIAALQWVKANATAFGGDPARVLLFGESGGALDTCALLSSPLAAGLFSSAIVQSGGCQAKTSAAASAASADYAAQLGCSGSSTASCLRALDAAQIVGRLGNPLKGGVVSSVFGPAVDGVLLPENPFDRIAAGRHNRVPLVIGTNRDEMAAAVPPGTVTPGLMNAMLLTVPRAQRDQASALYPPGSTNSEARDAYIRFTSDSQFICPARRIARAAAAGGSGAVYRYEFAQALANPLLAPSGAFHGLELFYLFQSLELSSIAPTLTPADARLSASMAAYWSAMAARGNPNAAGQVAWPAYDSVQDSYLELSATPAAKAGLRKAECDLWDQVIG